MLQKRCEIMRDEGQSQGSCQAQNLHNVSKKKLFGGIITTKAASYNAGNA